MLLKVTSYILLVAIAFSILFVSILRSASVKYSFSLPPLAPRTVPEGQIDIDYELVSPGKVLPGDPFWNIKVARDKLWLAISTSLSRKAELSLLFSDKRLVAAGELFEEGEYELGYMILVKGEGYLELAFNYARQAKDRGMDMTIGLTRIAVAALKHREVIDEILMIAPEAVRPEIIKTQDISRNVYKLSRDELNEMGLPVPKSPFEGD
jgi:hypothetical protein